MKKLWKILLALTMALGLSIGLIACSPNGGTGGGQGGGSVDGATDPVQERYAFSAATAGSILSAMNGGIAQQLAATKGLSLARTAVTEQETVAGLND